MVFYDQTKIIPGLIIRGYLQMNQVGAGAVINQKTDLD